MEDISQLLAGIASLLWPAIIFYIFLYLKTPLLKLIGIFLDGKLNIKIAGFELNLKESNMQQNNILLDLQNKILELERKIECPRSSHNDHVEIKSKSKKRILWVDDNPKNNAYLISALELKNIAVDTALTTEDAIEKINEYKYDLIISDMGRPGDDKAGITLTNKVKNINKSIPIYIFCGDWAAKNIKNEAIKSGVNGITSSGIDLLGMVSTQ